jgi:hypothetical protein
VTCFDRNFPGHELITAILDAGGHVIARVSATVALPLEEGGGWLPDGSRLTWLNAPSGKKEDRLPVRVTEHNAVMPSGDGEVQVSETCTVITTLLDHEAAPASQVRDTYLTRWSASETTFGEDKTTITGAGNRTSGPVPRSGWPRLVIQEAWAWLTATQLTRAAGAAALRGGHAAARALRRKDTAPVTADEESGPLRIGNADPGHLVRQRHRPHVHARQMLDDHHVGDRGVTQAECLPRPSRSNLAPFLCAPGRGKRRHPGGCFLTQARHDRVKAVVELQQFDALAKGCLQRITGATARPRGRESRRRTRTAAHPGRQQAPAPAGRILRGLRWSACRSRLGEASTGICRISPARHAATARHAPERP